MNRTDKITQGRGAGMSACVPYKKLFILSLIALVGVLSYSNSFSVPFQFDDDGYVVSNPLIRSFHYFAHPVDVYRLIEHSPTALPEALRYAFMTRILGHFSLAIDYALHGLTVAGYHIINLMIHIINAVLVYLIIKATLKTGYFGPEAGEDKDGSRNIIATATAMLFVSHPIQTQAVTYISQRFVLLAACFFLLSLLLYITARFSVPGLRRSALIAAALLSAVAAMLTKEFTFTLPFVIALYEMFFFRGSPRERLRALAPFAATLLIIPSLIFLQHGTVKALESTMRVMTAADVTNISRLDYLLTQFPVIMLYVQMLFLPVNQNVDHDITVYHSLLDMPDLASFLTVLALISFGVYLFVLSRRRTDYPEVRLASFGILWFFITLSVESSIIPLGELSAEYRLYLPSAGMFAAVIALGFAVAKRSSLRLRLLVAVVALAIIVLSTGTFMRNTVWASETALWEDAERKSPALVRPHQNLGICYMKQGHLEDARREITTALKLKPASTQLHNNLGVLDTEMGAFDEAIQEFAIVLKHDPGNAMARYNMGNAYMSQGKISEAISAYQVALGVMPEYDKAHNGLAIAFCQGGQIDAAIAEFNRALQINPLNVNARNNLEACIRKATMQTN